MSDPTMPAALAAILSEPGWERVSDDPVTWGRMVGVWQGGPAAVQVRTIGGIWFVRLVCGDWTEFHSEQLSMALDLMRRIEAALAQEGTS